MINYFKVAEILGQGWTTLDAQQAHEELESGFMVPDMAEFSASEAIEACAEHEGGADAGLYVRLSAPGYMDCTDWNGPFESLEAGLAHLIQTYGVE